MSLVMAAISYSRRRRLHSASISAVLPEPTGPPTPTRSGPFILVSMPALISRAEQPRVLGLVPHGGDVGAERRATDLVERCCQCPRGGRGGHRLEWRGQGLVL